MPKQCPNNAQQFQLTHSVSSYQKQTCSRIESVTTSLPASGTTHNRDHSISKHQCAETLDTQRQIWMTQELALSEFSPPQKLYYRLETTRAPFFAHQLWQKFNRSANMSFVNVPSWLTKPMNDRESDIFNGLGKDYIASTFFGSTWTPLADTM